MTEATAASAQTYRLRRPDSDAAWAAYRAIHLAADLGENDAEEDQAANHYPLLLWCDDRPVGALRIDNLDGERAAFRLVAIDPAAQGRGHGRALLRHAEAFARGILCRLAVVYATQEAAGFYAALGYAEDPFDEHYFGGVVQMTRPLHYAGFGVEDE
jgi:GNAT superfamily N-acetyltransferase